MRSIRIANDIRLPRDVNRNPANGMLGGLLHLCEGLALPMIAK